MFNFIIVLKGHQSAFSLARVLIILSLDVLNEN